MWILGRLISLQSKHHLGWVLIQKILFQTHSGCPQKHILVVAQLRAPDFCLLSHLQAMESFQKPPWFLAIRASPPRLLPLSRPQGEPLAPVHYDEDFYNSKHARHTPPPLSHSRGVNARRLGSLGPHHVQSTTKK